MVEMNFTLLTCVSRRNLSNLPNKCDSVKCAKEKFKNHVNNIEKIP